MLFPINEIPKNVRYYITVDIDAFDPSIAAGTGTPSHGGFYYYEVLELIDGIIKQGNVVGLDLVEVAPDYDLTNSTSTLAAQLLMNTIGRILIPPPRTKANPPQFFLSRPIIQMASNKKNTPITSRCPEEADSKMGKG